MLTSQDLQTYLDQQKLPAEIIYLDAPTPTVETAAEAVGVNPDQILKSVLFLVDDRPVLAIACGTARIDDRAIAAHFEVGRKRVKLADPTAVLEITGYPVGTVPPFGHSQNLSTLLDPCVFNHDAVYAGGGAEKTLLRIDPQTLARITEGESLLLREG